MPNAFQENAKLIALNGELAGQAYPLGERFGIGRDVTNNLSLRLPTVSRNHATIERGANGYILRDHGSHNGTYVNKTRIAEANLKDNDEISIGDVRFRFHLVTEETESFHSRLDFIPPSDSEREIANVAPSQTLVLPVGFGKNEREFDRLRSRYELLFRTNSAILSAQNLNVLFQRILDFLMELFPCENAAVLLTSREDEEPRQAAGRSRTHQGDRIVLSRSIVSRVIRDGVGVLTADARVDERFEEAESLAKLQICSAICAPLSREGRTLGAIYVDSRSGSHRFNQQDLETLCAMAGPVAMAVQNVIHLEEIEARKRELEQTYGMTVTALANAIEARDHYTVGHTWRVTHFARSLATELGWEKEMMTEVELGGVLHDIGKVGVDDGILRKPAALTQEEYEKMKLHPEIGARMLRDIKFLSAAVPYVLRHHERFDGAGYPGRLKGEAIPQQGRLLAIADAYDALTSHRPYQPAVPPDKSIQRMVEARGKHFDPVMLDAFVKVWESGTINNVLQDYFSKGSSVSCPFCSTYVPLAPQAKEGDIFECPVCRRQVRLILSPTGFRGELA
ncbi:MAG TPA: HD domain-containing protein [Candidatus Brocadiia bacterium]|nr:HD domain-containing protein [Candidatus Brocadiia bacterium]